MASNNDSKQDPSKIKSDLPENEEETEEKSNEVPCTSTANTDAPNSENSSEPIKQNPGIGLEDINTVNVVHTEEADTDVTEVELLSSGSDEADRALKKRFMRQSDTDSSKLDLEPLPLPLPRLQQEPPDESKPACFGPDHQLLEANANQHLEPLPRLQQEPPDELEPACFGPDHQLLESNANQQPRHNAEQGDCSNNMASEISNSHPPDDEEYVPTNCERLGARPKQRPAKVSKTDSSQKISAKTKHGSRTKIHRDNWVKPDDKDYTKQYIYSDQITEADRRDIVIQVSRPRNSLNTDDETQQQRRIDEMRARLARRRRRRLRFAINRLHLEDDFEFDDDTRSPSPSADTSQPSQAENASALDRASTSRSTLESQPPTTIQHPTTLANPDPDPEPSLTLILPSPNNESLHSQGTMTAPGPAPEPVPPSSKTLQIPDFRPTPNPIIEIQLRTVARPDPQPDDELPTIIELGFFSDENEIQEMRMSSSGPIAFIPLPGTSYAVPYPIQMLGREDLQIPNFPQEVNIHETTRLPPQPQRPPRPRARAPQPRFRSRSVTPSPASSNSSTVQEPERSDTPKSEYEEEGTRVRSRSMSPQCPDIPRPNTPQPGPSGLYNPQPSSSRMPSHRISSSRAFSPDPELRAISPLASASDFLIRFSESRSREEEKLGTSIENNEVKWMSSQTGLPTDENFNISKEDLEHAGPSRASCYSHGGQLQAGTSRLMVTIPDEPQAGPSRLYTPIAIVAPMQQEPRAGSSRMMSPTTSSTSVSHESQHTVPHTQAPVAVISPMPHTISSQTAGLLSITAPLVEASEQIGLQEIAASRMSNQPERSIQTTSPISSKSEVLKDTIPLDQDTRITSQTTTETTIEEQQEDTNQPSILDSQQPSETVTPPSNIVTSQAESILNKPDSGSPNLFSQDLVTEDPKQDTEPVASTSSPRSPDQVFVPVAPGIWRVNSPLLQIMSAESPPQYLSSNNSDSSSPQLCIDWKESPPLESSRPGSPVPFESLSDSPQPGSSSSRHLEAPIELVRPVPI